MKTEKVQEQGRKGKTEVFFLSENMFKEKFGPIDPETE